MSKTTYAKLKLSQKDYELLIMGLGLATGYALKWDVYGLTGSDANAVNINTKLLDLTNRIMESKDTYREHQEHPDEDAGIGKEAKKADKHDKADKYDKKLNGADTGKPINRPKKRPESIKEAQ